MSPRRLWDPQGGSTTVASPHQGAAVAALSSIRPPRWPHVSVARRRLLPDLGDSGGRAPPGGELPPGGALPTGSLTEGLLSPRRPWDPQGVSAIVASPQQGAATAALTPIRLPRRPHRLVAWQRLLPDLGVLGGRVPPGGERPPGGARPTGSRTEGLVSLRPQGRYWERAGRGTWPARAHLACTCALMLLAGTAGGYAPTRSPAHTRALDTPPALWEVGTLRPRHTTPVLQH